MSELDLVGLHEDGEHLVLEGQDGQRFRLPIDEALRAAVRRDRPQLEALRAESAGHIPPREVQARIRAGATATELAESTGMALEHVRRYEGPVLAEREFVAAQARATRIGHDLSAPVLGDLVTDRLATRSVDASSISWDAYRAGSAPWTVEVTFQVGDAQRSARWTYDAAARTVRATDDEARWLSETELADEPIPRRHLSAVRHDVEVDAALRPLLASVDVDVVDTTPPPAGAENTQEQHTQEQHTQEHQTQELLDDLSGRRGVRQPLDVDGDDDDEGFEGFGPQHTFDFDLPSPATPVPAAHPPHSRPQEATDARVLAMPTRPGGDDAARAERSAPAVEQPTLLDEGTEAPGPLTERARPRKGRASVPSWDEIVFGAKPE